MAGNSPIAAAFKLTPQEAVDYLHGRDQLTKTFNWQDVWQEEHAYQFTVSRLARLDILEAMRAGLTRSVEGDLSRRDWVKNAQSLLEKAGWWGRKEVLDPVSGEIVTTTFNAERLKLIFDTNIRMAYSAGLWQRIVRNKSALPYIRYITKRDERVRESHRSWDNVVLPVDHPFWKTHFPPNGWRCRCRVMSISQADYDKGMSPNGELLNKAAPKVEYRDWINKRTGVVERVPNGIDPGFAYNPGMARDAGISAVVRNKLDGLPAAMRRAALGPVEIKPVEAEFRKAVEDALAGIPESVRMTVMAGGYELRIAPTITDVLPMLAGKQPRGHDSGVVWEELDGGSFAGELLIVIAGSALEKGQYVATSTARAGELLRHEYGHALDLILRLSDFPEFIVAYDRDAVALHAWLD
ncbi:MAG: phage minor head protein, partial [Gallionella sp.]|nr:phage minor head protein [Gallionella sp.]